MKLLLYIVKDGEKHIGSFANINQAVAYAQAVVEDGKQLIVDIQKEVPNGLKFSTLRVITKRDGSCAVENLKEE